MSNPSLKHRVKIILFLFVMLSSYTMKSQKWTLKLNPFPYAPYIYLEEKLATKTSIEYYFGRHLVYTEDFGLSHCIFGISTRHYFIKDSNPTLNGFYFSPNMSYFLRDRAKNNHFFAGLLIGGQFKIHENLIFDIGGGCQYNFGQGNVTSNNESYEAFLPRVKFAFGYRF
jgi:hypothetical protein